MNRIFVPYPIEILLKIFAWIVVIIANIIDFFLTPFHHVGKKGLIAYSAFALGFSVYLCVKYGLIFLLVPVIFIGLMVAFVAALFLADWIDGILDKICLPLIYDIIFAPVCVSFRKPMWLLKIEEKRLIKTKA